MCRYLLYLTWDGGVRYPSPIFLLPMGLLGRDTLSVLSLSSLRQSQVSIPAADQSQLTWTAARRPSRTAWRRRSPRTTSCVPRRGRRAAAGAAVWRARARGSGTWPCRGPRAAARPRRGAWAAASAGRPQPRSWGASVTSHQQRPNMSSVSAATFIGLETKDVLGLSQFPPTAVVSYSDSVTCLSWCAEAGTRKINNYQ